MEKFCSNCGAKIEEGHLFCSECGTPSPKDEAPEIIEAPLTTPEEESMGLTLNPDVDVQEETKEPVTEEAVKEEPAALVMEAPKPEPSPVPAKVYDAPVPAAPAAPVAPATPVNPRPDYQAPVQQPVRPVITKEYKPVATAGYFFLGLLYAIPVLGLLMSIILTCAPKNINLRNYSKSVLIWKIIGLVILLIVVGICMFLADFVVDFFYDVVPIEGAGEWFEDILDMVGL